MNEILSNLAKVLPALFILAGLFGFLGWSLRGPGKAAPAKSSKPAASDKSQQDRAKNLETALEKSKAANKSLKAELDKLQAASVSTDSFENTAAELDAARKTLDTESKRISTLEADLKKANDTVKNLNARGNEADKAQKDRSFARENELSKAREELAILQNRPDDNAPLLAEIERLRESVAVSTRFAGEMRKREAAAAEALEKAEARLASLSDPSRPAAAVAQKVGPIGDSDRVAAAKAEVLRLVELNRQTEAAAPVEEIAAAPVEEIAAAPVEEIAAAPVEEIAAAPVEEIAAAPVEEIAAAVEKAPAADELFPRD